MMAARDGICNQVGPYGSILNRFTLVGKAWGGTVTIAVANPFATLRASLGDSPTLQKRFASKVLDHQQPRVWVGTDFVFR